MLGLLSELFMEMLGMLPLQLLMEIMSVRLLLIIMLFLDGNNPFAPNYAANYAPGLILRISSQESRLIDSSVPRELPYNHFVCEGGGF